MGYIDAHVHVWTDDVERYPLAEGYSKADMKPGSFTAEDILGHAEKSGVDRVVLVQMSYYGFDNSYMLDTMKRFPGTFGGIGVVDVDDPNVEDEMDRLGAQGVMGFRIQPKQSPAGEWLETEGYHRMFAHAALRRQVMCCLMNPDGLPSLDVMCTQYDNTSVIIDHLCRVGVSGEIREEEVSALLAMSRHRAVNVKVSAFYALGRKQPPHDDLLPLIQRVVDKFGARALMWGSDCPYQVQNETYEDGLAPLRDRIDFKTAGAKEWILGRTAESYFF